MGENTGGWFTSLTITLNGRDADNGGVPLSVTVTVMTLVAGP